LKEIEASDVCQYKVLAEENRQEEIYAQVEKIAFGEGAAA